MPEQKKWYFLQISWQYDRETEIVLHYRYAYTNLSRHALRFDYNKKISRGLFLRGRIEKVIESLQQKEGINLYQDIKIKLFNSLYLQGRYSSFQTVDYDARIYEYENDFPGCYAMSALYGKGHKYYIILSWQPFTAFSLRFKYRRLYFEGAESIGSGYALIPGDIRRDIRLQFYFTF
jgi:hypothetical protein